MADNRFYVPTEEIIRTSNTMRLANKLGINNFDDLMEFSTQESRKFFTAAFQDMGIVTKNNYQITPENIATTADNRMAIWMPGAEMNIADTHLRYAKIKPDAIAYYSTREDSGEIKSYSFAEIDRLSNRMASALTQKGLGVGANVAICMPDSVEAAVIYYGLQKAGAVVVHLGYALDNEQIDVRIADLEKNGTKVNALFTQDIEITGKEPRNLINKISALSSGAEIYTVLKGNVNIPAKTKMYDELMAIGNDKFESVPRSMNDTTDIIFSSATSSTDPKKSPKGICQMTISHVKAQMDFRYVFDVHEGDKAFRHSHPGWMVFTAAKNAFTSNGAAMVVLEGSYYGQSMLDTISKQKIDTLITIPGFTEHLLKAVKEGKLDPASIDKMISTSGAPNHEKYIEFSDETSKRTGKKIAIMQWVGGTELITYKGSHYTKPVHPCHFNGDTYGTGLHYNKADNQVFIILPKNNDERRVPPPGLSQKLANADNNAQYYPDKLLNKDGEVVMDSLLLPNGDRLRVHGDTFKKLENGDYVYTGRADDQKNFAGNKFDILQIQGWIGAANHPNLEGFIATTAKSKSGADDMIVVYYMPKEGAEVDKKSVFAQFRELVKKGNTLVSGAMFDVVEVPENMRNEMAGQLRTQKLKTAQWSKHYKEEVNPSMEPQFGKSKIELK